MPQLGDIQVGTKMGRTCTSRMIWAACEKCGKERWKRLVEDKPESNLCYKCSYRGTPGKGNGRWKGGRHVNGSGGYYEVWIEKDDFFYPMVQPSRGSYVLEHRLVMAKHLNRCLLPWEVVHHKNGIKTDNRIENLELLGANSKHNMMLNKEIKKLQREVISLQARVTLLESENALLKATEVLS